MLQVRVREYCRLTGRKYKWIYEQVGISKSHFSHWLNGNRDIAYQHKIKIKQIIGII